jgi:hypothetical protein
MTPNDDKTERNAPAHRVNPNQIVRANPENAGPLTQPIPAAFTPDEISTPPSGFPFIDTVLVKITAGPWLGGHYHLPNADAAQAIADKWAVDFTQTPVDVNAEPPPALTPEEQAHANEAAQAYVDSQITPPEEGEGEGGEVREGETPEAAAERRDRDAKRRGEEQRRQRDMQAGRAPGSYETRTGGGERK